MAGAAIATVTTVVVTATATTIVIAAVAVTAAAAACGVAVLSDLERAGNDAPPRDERRSTARDSPSTYPR